MKVLVVNIAIIECTRAFVIACECAFMGTFKCVSLLNLCAKHTEREQNSHPTNICSPWRGVNVRADFLAEYRARSKPQT